MGIMKPCHQFLHDKMLKGMTIVNCAANKFFAMQQVVGNSHIKIIESRCLDYAPFHHLGISRYAIPYQCILKNIKI